MSQLKCNMSFGRLTLGKMVIADGTLLPVFLWCDVTRNKLHIVYEIMRQTGTDSSFRIKRNADVKDYKSEKNGIPRTLG